VYYIKVYHNHKQLKCKVFNQISTQQQYLALPLSSHDNYNKKDQCDARDSTLSYLNFHCMYHIAYKGNSHQIWSQWNICYQTDPLAAESHDPPSFIA